MSTPGRFTFGLLLDHPVAHGSAAIQSAYEISVDDLLAFS
jgi:hypothetical protein